MNFVRPLIRVCACRTQSKVSHSASMVKTLSKGTSSPVATRESRGIGSGEASITDVVTVVGSASTVLYVERDIWLSSSATRVERASLRHPPLVQVDPSWGSTAVLDDLEKAILAILHDMTKNIKNRKSVGGK